MEELKAILKDIRNKLDNNVFQKEEHVRIGIVARICQALGWDIWNPDEFYTEFPIKMKAREGSVDVVLFHSLLKDKTPDVFFEIKAEGKLKGNIETSEDQLQDYNYYNTASITILTDGRIWRFYLSSAQGTFPQKMFCSFDLIKDREDLIFKIFKEVLAKNRFVKDAVNTADKMLQDLKLSREIERAKQEAIKRGDDFPDLNKYQLVQLILKERGHDISLDEIKRLWSSKGGETPDTVRTDPRNDYTFMSVKFIELKGFPRIDVSYWWEVKKHVYNALLKNHPNVVLDRVLRMARTKDDFRESITLDDGWFTEGCLSATDTVNHCRRALKAAGYDPMIDLVVGYVPSDKQKKTQKINADTGK